MGYGDEEEIKISDYNSAGFKMKRLHDSYNIIKEVDKNLWAWNPRYETYNYLVKLAECETLFQEVESKLTPKENDDVETLRNALIYFKDHNTIWGLKKSKVYPYKNTQIRNELNSQVISVFLSKYESMVRKLIDVHGMDTKYADDDGL